jgi:hypothetical protein
MTIQRSRAYNFAENVDNWLLDASATPPKIFRFSVELFDSSKDDWVELKMVSRAKPKFRGYNVGVIDVFEPLEDIDQSNSRFNLSTDNNLDHIYYDSVTKVRFFQLPKKENGEREIIDKFKVGDIELFKEFNIDTDNHIIYHRLVLFYNV